MKRFTATPTEPTSAGGYNISQNGFLGWQVTPLGIAASTHSRTLADWMNDAEERIAALEAENATLAMQNAAFRDLYGNLDHDAMAAEHQRQGAWQDKYYVAIEDIGRHVQLIGKLRSALQQCLGIVVRGRSSCRAQAIAAAEDALTQSLDEQDGQAALMRAGKEER